MDTYLVRIEASGVVTHADGTVDDAVGVQEVEMTADEVRAAGLGYLIEEVQVPEGEN